MDDKCPVCNTDIQKPDQSFLDDQGKVWRVESFSCPRCGDFMLDWSILRPDTLRDTVLKGDIIKIAVLSHWIRARHESIKFNKSGNESMPLAPDLVANIIRRSPPPCAEQMDKLILWLGNNSHPGEAVPVRPNTDQSIAGSVTHSGFLQVLDYSESAGLLNQHKLTSDGRIDAVLRFEGWQYHEKLRRGATDSRKAFMAMQYNEPELDTIVENWFRKAVGQTGFELFTLPDRPKAGLIDDRLRVEIRASRFLIADLTHQNRGAYWEAGYAEGLGRPVIYTCEKRKFKRAKTHFDTNHYETVLWDLEKPQDAAERLKITIRATLPEEAKSTDD